MNEQKFSFMTLLVVEDNKQSREHLVDILKVYFKEVLVSFDGCDALEKIERFVPNIIISDIKIPCFNGLSLISRVRTETYKPVVILTTAFSDPKYLLEAINMKVDGYLIKPIDVTLLLKKISEASYSIANTNLSLKYKKLSSREYEVFLKLAKGLKPLEIANLYNIKAKTVSTYRRRIFEKMSFTSNADLISYAIKNKLS